VGKTLRLDDETDFKITGVFENIPRRSHFHFDIVISLSTLEESRQPVWMTFNFPTYIVLRPDASLADLDAKLPALFNTHMETELRQSMGFSVDEFLKKSNMTLAYGLQPLTRIHLYSSGIRNEFEPAGDIKYVYLFAAVALFILILAAVNFVNLSTARSSGRAKEVGLRKVLGSQRGALVNQFLVESVLLSLIALGFGLVLVGLTLPLFNSLAGKELALSELADPATAAAALLLTLVIGLLAGAYPAALFSSFRPSSILRGSITAGMRGGKLRRVLVVFQSAVSVLMIIGTVVVFRQMHFIRTANLGFAKDQILVLSKTFLLGDRAEILKDEMKRLPQVRNASLSSYLPVPSSRTRLPIARGDDPEPYKAMPLNLWTVDEDYLDTLQIRVAEGRNFSRATPTDAEAVLINRTAAAHFGFAHPLGQKIILAEMEETPEGLPQKKEISRNVIGLVDDFHFESLRSAVAPLVIRYGKSRGNLILRVQPEGIASLIKTLQARWTSLLPGEPFEYAFLDERFAAMYAADLRMGRIFGVFAALSVLIGCLGVFGLASYAVTKRAREIGIHKVLGASGADIVRLMLREQILLTAAANLIAWPVAYAIMMNWLKGFAYRTTLSWTVFAGAGILTLIITLATVGGHAAKAVATDPALVLKNE
jgi:putative ABC transport system permease protein